MASPNPRQAEANLTEARTNSLIVAEFAMDYMDDRAVYTDNFLAKKLFNTAIRLFSDP